MQAAKQSKQPPAQQAKTIESFVVSTTQLPVSLFYNHQLTMPGEPEEVEEVEEEEVEEMEEEEEGDDKDKPKEKRRAARGAQRKKPIRRTQTPGGSDDYLKREPKKPADVGKEKE